MVRQHRNGSQSRHRDRLFVRRRPELFWPAAHRAAGEGSERSAYEAALAEGKAAQTGSLRWKDYTNIALDPADECTFWFVGNYIKPEATTSTTRIAAIALPGCK
jgi:hypothetical protein